MKAQRSLVKAIEEIKVDFNILRLHCGNRIRDAVFRKFAEIRQDSNIEMFQKEVLLKLANGMHFLQRHLPTYYEEIAKKYCEIMRNVVFQIFSEYSAAFGSVEWFDPRLRTRLYEVAATEELIVVEISDALDCSPPSRSLLYSKKRPPRPLRLRLFSPIATK